MPEQLRAQAAAPRPVEMAATTETLTPQHRQQQWPEWNMDELMQANENENAIEVNLKTKYKLEASIQQRKH